MPIGRDFGLAEWINMGGQIWQNFNAYHLENWFLLALTVTASSSIVNICIIIYYTRTYVDSLISNETLTNDLSTGKKDERNPLY